jgi:predicted small secreted protein
MVARLVAFAVAALIAGCNTMHGAGEDIHAGKNKVENMFSRHKDKTDQPSSTGAAPETTPPGTSATTAAPGSDTFGNSAGGTTQ